MKYGNKKTYYNDRLFDSKKEAEYAQLLDTLRNATESTERVVSVVYQPSYRIDVNGAHIATYKADFFVTYADGRTEVVDVKGFKTPVYRLKKKLVEALHGVTIVEV